MDEKKLPTPGDNLPANELDEEVVPDPSVDDFFNRMKHEMRRPKPGQEAVTAALHAIQRLGLQNDSETSVDGLDETAAGFAAERLCHACGSANPGDNRFCAFCGVPLPEAPAAVASSPASHVPGPHHYHHHYHHHYFSSDGSPQASASAEQRPANSGASARDAVRTRAPLGTPGLSRSEAAVRKMTQDWVQACNTKHLDDLVEIYHPDAIVLRPNVPPVRGTAAIREFFFSVLDAGLGEVELEPIRVELAGEIAYEAGRCKMLVPHMGKRREERGKYLVTLARQAGEWKILADCWSSDLSLGGGAESSTTPAASNPATRPPRKS
ncbi:MAG TPA: nuclear transport factor 2 family protein [Terriglobales bacterium]|nr:nuclear transport factor 2 family protein [Terriglobales bacterium]